MLFRFVRRSQLSNRVVKLMNFISSLYDEKKVLITLEKYDISDLSTPHTIRTIIDNFEEMKSYYEKKSFGCIDDINDYIDVLFLKFVTLYNEDSDYLLEPYKGQLKQVIKYSASKLNQVNNSSLVKFIASSYKDIFRYNNKYFKSGVKDLTIQLIIKFYNVLKNSGILEYMIREMPIFVYDKFSALSNILKDNNGELMRCLLLDDDNFEKLCAYRFENICETVERLYQSNFRDIACELGDKIYRYIENQFNSGTQHVYYLQTIIHRANKTLYFIRSEHSRQIENYLRRINEEAEKFLLENGQEFHFELSTASYDNLMEELDKMGSDYFTKYMTITHRQNAHNLWCSILEEEAKRYEPSLVDLVRTPFNSNQYFTYGKFRAMDLLITSHSMSLFYWFRNPNRVNEFRDSLKMVIDSIFEVLSYDTKYDDLDKDIDALIAILCDNRDTGKAVFYHMKAMFVITFLEKVLRLIYICIEENAFFERSRITLGTILGTSSNNVGVLDNIIGEHHHRWTRYYFLHEDRDVGLNYRNRLAHSIDISVGEITLPVFMKIVWLTLSTINSIFVNLINNG